MPIHYTAIRTSTEFADPFPSVSLEDRGNLRAELAGGLDVTVGVGSQGCRRYKHVAHRGFCHAALDEPIEVLGYLLLKLGDKDSCRLLLARARSLIRRKMPRLASDEACRGFRP